MVYRIPGHGLSDWKLLLPAASIESSLPYSHQLISQVKDAVAGIRHQKFFDELLTIQHIAHNNQMVEMSVMVRLQDRTTFQSVRIVSTK